MMRMVSRGGTEGGQAGAGPPLKTFLFLRRRCYIFLF